MFSEGDGTSVRDGRTGSTVCSPPNAGYVSTAEFSPDNEKFAVSYWGQGGSPRVTLFDVGTCETLSTMATERAADNLAFSPDSRYIAIASGLGPLISIWDLATGKKISSVSHIGGNGIDNIAFSPRGTFLATSGYDQVARIWDPKAGTEVMRIQGSSLPYEIDFSTDEKYVVTAFVGDNVARVWRTNNGAEVARMSQGAPILKAAFLSDGTGLATAGSDGFLRIWAMPFEGIQSHELADQVQAVALSPGGRYLSTVDSSGPSEQLPVLRVWDFAVRKEIFSKQLPGGPHGLIAIGSTNRRGTAVSSDGKRTAAVGYWRAVYVAYVWDTGTARPTFQADAAAPIDSVALSSDGQYLATVSRGEGKLLDISGQRSFPLGQFPISKVDFSGDSTRVVVVEPGTDRDSCLKEHRLPSGHRLHILKLTGPVEDIAISRRGRLIATTDGARVPIMDIAACRPAYNFEEKETITALAFDETEELLVAATAQGSAQISRLRTNDRVYRVHHEGYLATVGFSNGKDGDVLLTANGHVPSARDLHSTRVSL
jgi:WD40 repeat protein